MKMVVFMLLATFTMASAKSYSQNVTLDMKNTRMELVLNKIVKLSGYSFIYEKNLFKKVGKIDVSLHNKPLEDAISEILKGQPFDYVISNKFIVISPKTNQGSLALPKTTIQFIKITGTVSDTTGLKIPNVSVLNKSSGKATITNKDGAFSIDANTGDRLLFSSIGYAKQEIIIGSQTNLTVVLREEKNQLEQVVVTALGIKKQTRSLTYNVQEIKGEELTRNKDASFINSLVGKVAGVTINSSAAGVGGPVRVVMRGIKSLTGNNNALYVVDGVPLQTLTSAQPSDVYNGYTSSEGISSINPDDIESISVLTGAAAAALYGSLGLNGVVQITTKSGIAGKTAISLSNNTGFYSPFVMPDFQNTYGVSSPGQYYSWGVKLKEPSSYNPKDFFQTGFNQTYALNFSTGTEKNQTYISAALVDANGIIPNNELSRYNFSARNTSSFLNDRLNLDVNAQYIYQKEQNMVAQGLYNNPLVPVYLFPPGDDFSKYEAYERYDAARLIETQFWPYGSQGSFQMQNPYWITNRNLFTANKERFIIGASLKYKIIEGLTATGRIKYDYNVTNNQTKLYASTLGLFSGYGGRYANINTINKQLYSDVIVNLDKKINDFSLNANVGVSNMDGDVNGVGFDGGILEGAIPNLFTLSNLDLSKLGSGGLRNTNGPRIAMRSVFTTAELGYKNMIFINGSYRADWWSQLSGSTSSNFTYPSVGVSAILSDLFKIKSNAISFIKVRGTYSEVGNTPQPYVANSALAYPVTNGQVTPYSRYPSPTLEPERSKSYEVGLNVKFLNNRINLDLTAYKTNTYNQIFATTPSGATGFTVLYVNAGQLSNKGIEASLGYNGNMGNLQWTSNLTFSLNRNKIVQLMDNFYDPITNTHLSKDSLLVASTGSYAQYLIKGGSAGDIYVSTLLRDPGRRKEYILNGNNTVVAEPNRFVKAGSPNPDYTLGFNNSFSYKGINLSFLITARVGGVGISATQAFMDGFGVSQKTAEDRDRGYVTINGAPNSNIESYYGVVGGGINGVLSEYVYSATNVRLRELSLGYTIPSKIYKLKFIREVSLALTGQNLFMFYNKAPFDPESTASTATYFQGIDYFMQPSLRNVGFSIKVKL